MNIGRRHLAPGLPALGLLAIGLLAATPAVAVSVDEEAVAKRLEALRAAQFAHDAKALDALCADEREFGAIRGNGGLTVTSTVNHFACLKCEAAHTPKRDRALPSSEQVEPEDPVILKRRGR